jgi:hypothetical protein
MPTQILIIKKITTQIKKNKGPNYKLHPLTFAKVQFSLLSFDRFNLVL